MSRNMQFGKIDTMMGMSADEVSNAQAMEAAGNAQMMAGIGDAASGLTSFAGAMDGNWGGGAKTTGVQHLENTQGVDFSTGVGTGATGGSGMGGINPFQPGTVEHTNWLLENG